MSVRGGSQLSDLVRAPGFAKCFILSSDHKLNLKSTTIVLKPGTNFKRDLGTFCHFDVT